MAQDIAYTLAEFAANISLSKLPLSAVDTTKKDIYDSLSTGIAGSSARGVAEMLRTAQQWGGAEQATTFVFGKKLPAHVAAWLNTTMIHGYDYDDTHDIAMMHCGNIMVSVALATAEMMGGVSGADLVAAITAGLDIHCRLGLASTIGIVQSGWIYTPLFGIFGAVATAGRVMHLSEAQILNAFGIAYSQAAGNYQAITDSAWTKRMQPGFASQAAIVACELAKEGVIGAHNVFEGRYGLYHVYLNDHYDPEPLRNHLGSVFTHEELAFKPWPCGRPCQPPINAALEAREKFHPEIKKIKHIEILMNEHLYVAGCVPENVRKQPRTVVDGQFSSPYNAACALVNGKVGLTDYTEDGIRRADVLEISNKIDCIIDPMIEQEYHARVCPVVIRIEMQDGKILEHRLEKTLGCKEKPMTDKDIREKMEGCVAASAKPMPKETPDIIRALVDNLETLENSNALVEAMQAEK